MKFCSNCGAELPTDVDVCRVCDNTVQNNSTSSIVRSVLTFIAFALSIVTLVVSTSFTVWYFSIGDIGFLLVWVLYMACGFTLSVVSLVLSIVAVCIVVKRDYSCKGFAVAGIVMSGLSFCMSLIILFYPFLLKLLV